jgi:hypothetical protein
LAVLASVLKIQRKEAEINLLARCTILRYTGPLACYGSVCISSQFSIIEVCLLYGIMMIII